MLFRTSPLSSQAGESEHFTSNKINELKLKSIHISYINISSVLSQRNVSIKNIIKIIPNKFRFIYPILNNTSRCYNILITIHYSAQVIFTRVNSALIKLLSIPAKAKRSSMTLIIN